MNDSLSEYYRCPEKYARVALEGPFSGDSGYFTFGEDAVCYGGLSGRYPARSPKGKLHDALADAKLQEGRVSVPFDPARIADNLRFERYSLAGNSHSVASQVVRKSYYFVRPLLPVKVRKHLQKAHLNGWDRLSFPHWPVDTTVDTLFERLLILNIRAQGLERIPFIWFWPDGASSCAVMTHDVETTLGRDFSSTLMDINDSFGIKASFQVVPEKRYEVPKSYLESLREREFEINVQDLNHDGRLYSDRETFMERVGKINQYGREYRADGFRAAVLYRQQDWYDQFEFAYDMSVPNVAHLDPQRGGCCTVMPYFVGKLLELPVTMTQDYPLFHILNEYSLDLWKRQADLIMQKHGFMNFIVHPDYITTARERAIYEALLDYMVELRNKKDVWIPIPGDVNRWWRQRAAMKLVEDATGWHIAGEGAERARIAYASEKDGRMTYTLTGAAEPAVASSR